MTLLFSTGLWWCVARHTKWASSINGFWQSPLALLCPTGAMYPWQQLEPPRQNGPLTQVQLLPHHLRLPLSSPTPLASLSQSWHKASIDVHQKHLLIKATQRSSTSVRHPNLKSRPWQRLTMRSWRALEVTKKVPFLMPWRIAQWTLSLLVLRTCL